MTTGKTTALTFVGKVMSLLYTMLSRFVITFLPKSKHLLISWLQSPSKVILEHKKIKSVTISIFSPSICHEVMGPDAMILVFWMLSFKSAFSLSFTFNKRLFNFSTKTKKAMILRAVWHPTTTTNFFPKSKFFPSHEDTTSSPTFTRLSLASPPWRCYATSVTPNVPYCLL